MGRICHPVCSVSVTPSKARLIGFCYKWKFQSIATERNSRVSLCFTQLFLTMSMRLGCCSSNDDLLDGSTEWLIKLAHRCWPPLPTNRIACDAGSDDLLRKMCHPVCSVSTTPSKAWLIGFCNMRRTPVHCHREKQQGFTTLHSAVSHNVNEVGKHIYK